MEDFEDVSLGFVFSQEGLEYYSIQPVKHATGFEKLLLILGCEIKGIYILESSTALDCFLRMDYDYRKNVWVHLPKPVLH